MEMMSGSMFRVANEMTKPITLFTIPKPFIGHIGNIQHNALASWSLLPGVQCIILGNEEGVAEASAMYGFHHIPSVPRNGFGTPFLDAAFRSIVQEASRDSVIVFSNADIILLPTLLKVIASIKCNDFLIAARRYNVEQRERCPVTPEAFALIELNARMHCDIVPSYSSDVFVLPSHSEIIKLMPKMLIGRKGWDNWMMWAAKALNIPLIDATDYLVTVHQNHNYDHIKTESPHPSRQSPWQGPESDYQEALIGNKALSLDFADSKLKSNGVLAEKYHGLQKLYWECEWRARSTDMKAMEMLYRLIKWSLLQINCKAYS
jgi:hypothetical protein